MSQINSRNSLWFSAYFLAAYMGFQMDAEMSQLQPYPQGAPQLGGEAEARTGLGHRMAIAYTCSLPGTVLKYLLCKY